MFSKSKIALPCTLALVMMQLPQLALAKSPDNACKEPAGGIEFQTELPHTAPAKLSRHEHRLLVAYLDEPDAVAKARRLAKYNLSKMMLSIAGIGPANDQTETLRRTVYSNYFLNRARQLGDSSRWLDESSRWTQRMLAAQLPLRGDPDHTEGTEVQLAFYQAFARGESDRYRIEERLLAELLNQPNAMLTSLYTAAANLWNASEAAYCDPTVLYSYLMAAYLGEHTEALAKTAQQQWQADPEEKQLFKAVTAIAGTTIPSRRWIAKLHRDDESLTKIDAELAQWLDIYPQFYSWPAAVIPLEEPGGLLPALTAYMTGIEQCEAEPIRVCGNTPMAPFNAISFQLLGMGIAMRLGDTGWLEQLEQWKSDPSFAYDAWPLGQAAWEQRVANAEEISARYLNDNPDDDPANAFINRQKWGVSSTCQLCHQHQEASIPDYDLNQSKPRQSDEYLFIDAWPERSVNWHLAK